MYFCFIDCAKAFDSVDHNKLWKNLQEMGIPEHLTFLLKNLYAGQETTVRTRHGTKNWFQIGKGLCEGCILSPYLFNYYAEYIMWMQGQMKHKLESRPLGEISITSDMQMTPSLWQKAKSLLMKEESGKVDLKLNIQKTKIMASRPITSWQIDQETMETVRNFILGGLQNHCRWWLQPWN